MATIYLLSTENLRRDPEELDTLLEIITDVVEEISGPSKNWSVQIVGALDLLPAEQSRRLRDAADGTEGRTGTHVNIAIGYGGRQEIADAVQSLLSEKLSQGLSGDELVQAITVDGIDSHLYTSGQPDPDLVIRTSGEQRLSGFLLWQSAYSEIWFTEAYWPEFRRGDFLRALRDYAARHRRFGACAVSELAQAQPVDRVIGVLAQHQRCSRTGGEDVLHQVRLIDRVPDVLGGAGRVAVR